MPRVRAQSGRSGKAKVAVTDSPASQRAFALLVTSAGMLLLFAGYCLATRTLHAKAGTIVKPSPVDPPSQLANRDQTSRMAAQYLSRQPWAASSDYQGQTVDKTLFYYCNEYQQENKKTIRIQPFAMVLKRKDSQPTDRPYTIVSATAYITFAREFDILSGSPGPIVNAELQGDVVIEGPHNLWMQGKNFYFQRLPAEQNGAMKIYSDDHVEFRADRHKGSAKGVQIELIKDDKAQPDEPLGVAGVNSVKLLSNVDMTLVSDSPQQIVGAAASKIAAGTQPVKIHSAGSFLYVLSNHVATFERDVRIRRDTTPAHDDAVGRKSVPAKYDSLTADDSVEIVFDIADPKAARPKDRSKAVPSKAVAKPTEGHATAADLSSTGLGENLQFKKLHARGNAVKVVSQTNGLSALMRDFVYDKTTRTATLSVYDKAARMAKLPPGRDSVVVLQNGNQLRAPEIVLTHTEQGDDVTEVLCRGKGSMEHQDEKTKQIDLTAEWLKEMHKYPDPDPSFDRIDFEEAIIEQRQESSGIAASHIRLWVAHQSRDHQGVRPNMPPADRRQNGFQLHHMVAKQNVAMVSPQLELYSELLAVRFEPAPPNKTDVKSGPPGLPRRPDPQVKPAGSLDERTPSPKSVLNGTAGKNGEPEEPYHLSANEIHVRVLQGADGQQPQVAEAILKTNAVLTQKHAGTSEELRIDGSELHVENRGQMDQEMVVVGQPAHVIDRGAHIEGSRIRFNRAKSTADVDGAGRLQLPTKQATTAQHDASGMPLDVFWKDQMHFDGKAAHFEGNVRTTMDDGKARSDILCRTMDVTLRKPFSFTQERASDEQSEVEVVFCNGGVELNSKATLEGQVAELRRGAFVNMTFHRSTGRGEAAGPGWFCVWRHNKNGQSGLSQSFAKAQANAPPKNRKVSSWEFTKITFATLVDGDFREMMSQSPQPKAPAKVQPAGASSSVFGSAGGAWSMTFHGDVQVLYGPVDQPMDAVSRDELPDHSGWLRSDTLDVVQHPETETQPSHVTLLGTGNCQIEGKEFRGEADTISYDGSKGWHVLHGDTHRHATICRQKKVGGDWSPVTAIMLSFNPDTGQLKIDQATRLDGSQ